MPLETIGPQISSQPLNDNFAYLDAQLADIVEPFTASIFVSATGDDGNDGLTVDTPVATLQKAVDIWADNRYKSGTWTIKVAAGTYTEGAIIDNIISPSELLIEGELSAGVPASIIDGTSASNISALNFNQCSRIRVRYMKAANFSNSGFLFQNGTYGVIDTCDAEGIAFAAFSANQYSNMDIIGTCNVSVPTGGKGVRYYRQCTGSWSDAVNTITIDGNGNVADGIEIRDNSYIVAADGVVINDFADSGVLIRRHSYVELRTATVSNCAEGITLEDLSLFAHNTGTLTLTSNTSDYSYNGFSLPFGTTSNVAVGSTGPSVQALSSGYSLIVSHLGQTGIQMLTDGPDPINIDFNKKGRISYVQSDNSIRFTQNAAELYRMRTDAVIPLTDNSKNLGVASNRWGTVYAGTGTINTSDEREKQQVRTLTEKEKAVANSLKGLIRAFKYNDAVLVKGDGARIHFGVMAQEVKAAFEAEGLVAEEYAVLCYDEWDEQKEIRDNEGNVLETYRQAGNRYGIRYDELLAFIISTL